MREITKIIVHCTATPEGREVDVEEIRKWHTEERGWSDVGYHFHIKLDGTLQEARPIERTGAHCAGQNFCSIGISYAGGMTKDMKKWKVLRVKNPKGKTSGKNVKDGKVFNPKGKRERPKYSKDLVCKQMGKATVCFDKGSKKRADGKKVKHKKK